MILKALNLKHRRLFQTATKCQPDIVTKRVRFVNTVHCSWISKKSLSIGRHYHWEICEWKFNQLEWLKLKLLNLWVQPHRRQHGIMLTRLYMWYIYIYIYMVSITHPWSLVAAASLCIVKEFLVFLMPTDWLSIKHMIYFPLYKNSIMCMPTVLPEPRH